MNRIEPWLCSSFLLALGLAACANSPEAMGVDLSADAGSSSGDPDPGGDDVGGGACVAEEALESALGGYVRLERFVGGDGLERTMALSEVYTGHSGPGRVPNHFYADFPVDRCFQVPLVPAEPSFYDFIDVGPMMRLTGPSAEIEMPKTEVFDNIFYRAAGLGASVVGGETYAVSSSLVSGDLRMPAEPDILEPHAINTGSVQMGAEITIRWQPTQSDRLFLVMQQGDIGHVCRMEDDGEFKLPADTALMIPSWGTISIVAWNRDLVDVGGRAVELVGLHGRSAEYERVGGQ